MRLYLRLTSLLILAVCRSTGCQGLVYVCQPMGFSWLLGGGWLAFFLWLLFENIFLLLLPLTLCYLVFGLLRVLT